jgi:hypothetical protein
MQLIMQICLLCNFFSAQLYACVSSSAQGARELALKMLSLGAHANITAFTASDKKDKEAAYSPLTYACAHLCDAKWAEVFVESFHADVDAVDATNMSAFARSCAQKIDAEKQAHGTTADAPFPFISQLLQLGADPNNARIDLLTVSITAGKKKKKQAAAAPPRPTPLFDVCYTNGYDVGGASALVTFICVLFCVAL